MFIPKLLAKYYSDTRWENIFHKWTIRFSPPEDLNDPFECNPAINSMMTADTYRDLMALHGHKRPIYKLVQENESLIEPSLEILKPVGMLLGKIFNSYSRGALGIFCLTAKLNNMLMWSHYGNSHKGFIVVFDPCHEMFLKRNSLESALIQVEYITNRYNGALFDNEISRSHLQKSKIWEYEKEYRVITRLKSDDYAWINENPKGLAALCPKAVKGVIFGACMPDESIKEKVRFLHNNKKSQHIWVKRAKLHPTKYRMQIVDVPN